MASCAERTTPKSFLLLQSIVGGQYFQAGSPDFQTKSASVQLHGKTWTPVRSVLALYKRCVPLSTNQLNESANDNYEVVFNALFTQQTLYK